MNTTQSETPALAKAGVSNDLDTYAGAVVSSPIVPHLGAECKSTMRKAALSYATDLGWPVLPVAAKAPATPHGFYDASDDQETIGELFNEAEDVTGVGVRLGGPKCLIAPEMDRRSGGTEQAFARHVGAWPGDFVTPTYRTSDGLRMIFRAPPSLDLEFSKVTLAPGIEVFGHKHQVVLPPSVHPSGVLYEWLEGLSPAEVDVAPMPDVLVQRLQHRPKAATNGTDPKKHTGDVDPETVKAALAHLDPWAGGYDDFWLKCLMAVHSAFPDEYGLAIAEAWADGRPGEVAKKWRSFAADGNLTGAVTIGTLYHFAMAAGWEGPPKTASDEALNEEKREDLTDLGNARRLVRLYGQNLRYVEAWGWLVWDGKRWQKDETGAVMRLAKRTALTFYQDAAHQLEQAAAATKAAEDASAIGDEGTEKTALDRAKAAQKAAKALTDHAKRCQARSQLENMAKLAQSEPIIPAVPDDFDSDPWLLNVTNGLLDLRTGTLRPHERAALCTKLAPVAYDPTAACPLWLAFLDRIFASDQSLVGFVQRLVGYSLTGSTRDHVLPFCHGRGANGKSTLTGAIMAVMGDYAQKARRSLVTLGRNDDGGPTPDKARLKGARFVVVNETEEGRRLAESDVKDLTGSDRITAAYKYKDPFEFDPTHTLWLYGNGKPQITGTDEGIWRRVKYIPFEVVIPEKERDVRLPEKLAPELPGILAWAVAGCLDWQRAGLCEPEKVRKATAAYREEQDVLAAFLADCCIDGPTYEVTATDLYGAYKTWCEETGVKPESQRRLAPRLRERGYTDKDARGEKYTDTQTRRALWRGLTLADHPVQEALPNPLNPLNPLFRKSSIESKKTDIVDLRIKDTNPSKDSEMEQDAWEEGEL